MIGRITERAVAELIATKGDVYLWDDQCPGFAVRARPSGYKTYVFKHQQRGQGRQKWLTIGRVGPAWNAKQARRKAEECLGDAARGHNPASRIALTEFAERFFTEGCPRKKPSTMRTHRGTFRNHLQPLLGARPVRSITEREVARAITAITGGATIAAYSTENKNGWARVRGGAEAVAKAARLLSMIFGFAQQIGLRADNPAATIAKRFPMYKQQSASRAAPSADQSAEIRRLIEHYAAEQKQRDTALARGLTELGVSLERQEEILGGVLRHQVGIAREVGAVEKPKTPRIGSRQPLK
jgi:hypothetical protein